VDSVTWRAWIAGAALGGAIACTEWAGPTLAGGPRFAIVPVFGGTSGTVLLNDLDQLHVTVTGSGAGVVVADTTVSVDSAGDVKVTVTVLIVGTAPQTYTVQLQGIRSSDGTVLYSGFDTVTVEAGRATRVDSVPVAYLGPCQATVGCIVTLGPQNFTLPQQAASLAMTVAVDSLGGVPVLNMPVRLTNVTPGLIGLASDLTVTALSGTSCGPARVAVSIPGASDTLRLVVSAPVTIPAILFAGDSSGGLSSGVFCQNTNGTGRFHLSANGATGDVNPRYSPDRQRVAYTFRSAGPSALFVARWAGDSDVPAVIDTSAYRPRWSPNGAHLAFACGDGFSPDQDVCVFPQADATVALSAFLNAMRIFVTDSVLTRPNGPSTFAWDPGNPDRLAFARDSLTGTGQVTSAIYTANFDGTGITRLTPQPMDVGAGVLQLLELAWSPRGDVIVFSATDPRFQTKLYAINRDGTGLRQLTKGPDSDSRPVGSPDGSQILFLRNVGGCAIDYWRIGLDGTGEQQVTSESFCDISTNYLGHDWSPDGKQIVLVGAGPNGMYGGFMVYRLPAGTTAASYVASRIPVRDLDPGNSSNDFQPSWRP